MIPEQPIIFISSVSINHLEMSLDETEGHGLLLGIEVLIKGEGVCLSLQGVNILENFLLLDLNGSGLILGMQWL